MSVKFKSVLIRFLKGAIAGGATALGLVTYQIPTAWSDFPSVLNTLAIVFAGGCLTGLILAIQKFASWEE